jgi:hypothetical protein
MNRFSASSFYPISVLTCAAFLAACGGGSDPSADELAAREEALKAPITIQSYGPNAVSIWNEIAFKTAGNVAGHDLVTTHLAMYDAVIAIAGTHQPYAIRPTTSGAGGGEVAMNAAAIEAAYRVLKGLFPAGGANYETPYTDGMAAIPESAAKSQGMAIGAEVAAGMLALRANDGRATVLPPYVPGTLPGEFRGSEPIGRINPYVKPFATISHSQFRAPAPPALNSSAYAIDLNEVQLMASATSTQRSEAQTETARFFSEPPNPYWARNLRQFATASPNLADNARLTAMIWTAYQDAISGCFESKYHYNFWRPTSAIRLADTDGNPATLADPAWVPVVPTPNHPEYPAAHGCGGGAVAEALHSFYDTKKLVFDFTSTATGQTHHYNGTDELTRETIDARVWGGMHFRNSGERGVELGKAVSHWIANNFFKPVQ